MQKEITAIVCLERMGRKDNHIKICPLPKYVPGAGKTTTSKPAPGSSMNLDCANVLYDNITYFA
jgi:hypothetical protein